MRWRALFLCLLLGGFMSAQAAAPVLPEALKGWEPWVLHGEDWRDCPFFADQGAGAEQAHACVLAGPTQIVIGAGSASVAQDVRVYAAGWLPLVHAENAGPEELALDARAVPVEGEPPSVWLEAGAHQLRYRLDLRAQPESLSVPESLRLVQLTVEGKPVFPLNREGDQLWLQRAQTTTEADALELRVHRLWVDGIPQTLQTQLQLHVAGKAREIRLGPAWPEGYELTRVDGDLPAVVEPGRVLRVQATAGSFTLSFHARALAPGERLGFDFPQGDWPAQEIWSFAANHALRVVDVSGDAPIDPSQADVPAGWRDYPAFAIASGDALTLAERSRGFGDDANRLTLQRELWLDFDGGGYTVQDHLYGRMRQGFRLDLAAPLELASASEAGQPLLVTAGAGEGLRGVEVRIPALQVEATARLAWTTSLPASGWSERLDGLSTTLHLPPGWRLLHAEGADRAEQAWSERWDIYAVFIAAFAVVLGWRYGGLRVGAAVALLMLLGMHEPGAPRYSLIALLLLLLGASALGAGRIRRALWVAAAAAALVFAWTALPFALQQARLAMHPQLAGGGAGHWNQAPDGFPAVELAVQEEAGMAPPPPPPAPAAPAMDQAQSLERIEVSGTRLKRADLENAAPVQQMQKALNLERYAKDAVVQAGVGRPSWQWLRVELGFDGPVDREQVLGLWLSPPWMTAAWRWLLVGALALLVWLLLRRMRQLQALRAASPVLLAALLLIAGPATAGELPDSAMLEQLHTRLTEPPECGDACARYGLATLGITAGRLDLAIEVHAGARVLVPLPLDDSVLDGVEVRLDGASAAVLGASGAAFVASERGVHRIELSARLRGDRVALDFALAPARVELDAPGWTAAGLRDGRLLAERLELVREAPSVAEDAASAPARVPVKPFVSVVRDISLDLDWTVHTSVQRVAPVDGGYSVRVPLLAGEQPLDPTLRVDAGVAEVTLQPGSSGLVIGSRLARSETLTLQAPELTDRAELWRVRVGPSLSLQTSGVPASAPEFGIDESQPWVHEFRPLPGETLSLRIGRPAAVPGATVVADRVELRSEIGARSRTESLALTLRATQGGNRALKLPAQAELLGLSIDGRSLNLKPENGSLSLPIKPGTQQVELSWRQDEGIGLAVSTPELDLGLEAANISLKLALPADRWLLRLSGPAVGPAVLYWSALVVLLALGYGLGRSGRALLPARAWMLLVLGFSTLSYEPLLLVVVAFLALDARARHLPGTWGKWRFDFAQIILLGLAVAAFGALVLAIPAGLLGSPQMHVAGSPVWGELAWLADRASGALPQAGAISLPIWVYKGLMLAFALWLAWALVGWLKLAWRALTQGTGWMRLRRRKPVAAATPG